MAYLKTVSYEDWMDEQSDSTSPSTLDVLILKEEIQELTQYAKAHHIEVEDIPRDVALRILSK